jgi:hypothetical protein
VLAKHRRPDKENPVTTHADRESSTPLDDGDEAATRAYLDEVRREIDDEVRRRRAAGDFPPSFERKLDELFARFTPTGTSEDHFSEALKLADRAAYFDIAVPIGSRRTAKGAVRYTLWQAEAWFVKYVVTQLNHFSASAMRVLHLLDERVGDLEHEVDLLAPPALPDEAVLSAPVDATPFLDALLARYAEPSRRAGGRVLHAECAGGELLGALTEAGVDAYGIDPGTTAADAAARRGLDVRRDDVLGHLASVADEALAGIVLSGCVDRLTTGERRHLVRLAELKLAPGGTVAILGTMPGRWARAAGPVAADLSPGRPLHPETWAYLFGQVGFADVGIVLGPPSQPIGRVDEGQSGAEVVNRALVAVEELIGGPTSYAVLATKRA